MQRKSTGKIIIAILSVLLLISIILLILLYTRGCSSEKTIHTEVSGNIITYETEPPYTNTTVSVDNTTPPAGTDFPTTPQITQSQTPAPTNAPTSTPTPAVTPAVTPASTGTQTPVRLSLYRSHGADNAPFAVNNMLPGDSVTEYYNLRVSYKGTVTVEFKPDIHEGYEILAEVLKCKIVLTNNGKVLYDGVMAQMPASVKCTLKSNEATEEELLYEVTVYLDTSVGNRYQNKQLAANFQWWVSDTGPLEPPGKTGENFTLFLLYLLIISLSICLLIILVKRRKRDEKQ